MEDAHRHAAWARRDRALYTIWFDQGLLMATVGNTTNFKFIEAEIPELASRFVFTEPAYVRTFAGEIARNFQDDGISLAEFGQGFLGMGPAAAEFPRSARLQFGSVELSSR
jgi:phage terminase large subunit-like protein